MHRLRSVKHRWSESYWFSRNPVNAGGPSPHCSFVAHDLDPSQPGPGEAIVRRPGVFPPVGLRHRVFAHLVRMRPAEDPMVGCLSCAP